MIYELDRPLLKAKNKEVIRLIKGELGGKMIKEFVALRVKTYSYLTENRDKKAGGKKTKGTKKCVIKRKLKFKDCKNF